MFHQRSHAFPPWLTAYIEEQLAKAELFHDVAKKRQLDGGRHLADRATKLVLSMQDLMFGYIRHNYRNEAVA
jgi:hypothetical protein